MSGSQGLGIAHGAVSERRIVSFGTSEVRTGTFVEGEAKPRLRYCRAHRFVKVFDPLNKVRLPHDDIGIRRKLHRNGFDFQHIDPPSSDGLRRCVYGQYVCVRGNARFADRRAPILPVQ